MVGTYFTERRALAMSLVTTATSVGSAIYPLVIPRLLDEIGFGWTMRTIGFLNLTLFLTATICMRPKKQPPAQRPLKLLELSMLQRIDAILFLVGISGTFAAYCFTIYYITSFCEVVGHENYDDATHLLAIMNGIGVPAQVFFAFSWMAVRSSGGIYAFICVYGLVQAGWQSIFAASATSFARKTGDSGACIGITFTAVAFAMLVGGPIGGTLISSDEPISWTLKRGQLPVQHWDSSWWE
ncbi:hypothetical protein UA08_08682 [Talaromyces atroroseus]|uniref:Major facilitator superfamily (MFS) profile domain-containing protein n=1 Tax=Talaromyces atroroseus TaxID=1441469 RepID=A0A225ABG1_TALAT|nr:hypothetical protein UA08_08682 [Talaromyces atroroseus]OKL56113.1 hypothetical protein UA08_08682 [Talaromyces atroroseus]